MRNSIAATRSLVDNGKWLGRAITARGGTIAGGSNEIQRNIIGERVLKLPR